MIYLTDLIYNKSRLYLQYDKFNFLMFHIPPLFT